MGERKKPLLSVVVPVYNAAGPLFECVESILGQSYKNLELVLVDDGSSDGSAAICDKFAVWDDRVKVIHQENGGASHARNQGFLASKGDYIHFCDADDKLEIDAYRRIIDMMEESDADVAYFGWKFQKKRGYDLQVKNGRQGVAGKHELLVDCLIQVGAASDYSGYSNYIWNKLFKRSMLIDENAESILFNETIPVAEDFEWLLRVIPRACVGVFLSEPLYVYKLNKNSTTRSAPSKAKTWLLSQDVHVKGLKKLREEIGEEYFLIHKETCLGYFMACLKQTAKEKDFDSARQMIENMTEINDGVLPDSVIKAISDLTIIYPKYREQKTLLKRRLVRYGVRADKVKTKTMRRLKRVVR